MLERKGFWILIAVSVACGMFLEILKGPAPVHIANMVKVRNLLDEGRPVYIAGMAEDHLPVTKHVGGRTAPQPPPIPPAPPVEAAPVVAPVAGASPTPKPTPVDPKKKAEEDKKKADEKKKKDLEEKKKKKQEAAEQAAADAANTPPVSTDDPVASNPPAADDVAGKTPPPAPANEVGPPLSGGAHQSTETAAEWETYLLKNPSSAKTAQFVKYYKSGLVKAPVFYAVIRAMLADPNAANQEQGVAALSETPSAESFTLLVDTNTKSTDPTVKAQAGGGVQTYSQVANLHFLTTAITGTDEAASLEAMQLVQTSANANLNATAQATSTTGSAVPSAASLAHYYSGLLASLQTAETRGLDATVRSTASQTLADLQGLLAPLQVTQN